MINGTRLCLGCMAERTGEKICPRCGWRGWNSPESPLFLAPGTVLNKRYLIGRVLGHGGFGITYLSFDLDLRIKLALKEYLPGNWATRVSGDPQISVYSGQAGESFAHGLERFVAEARILAKFYADPCIVLVHGFFQENGAAYIVMEYVEGITFHEFLDRRGGKIFYDEAMRIINPVLEAFRKVNAAGILHRDISPDNIYIAQNGRVKLLDFGSVHYAPGERNMSLSVLFKPGYAPLEQDQTRGEQGAWTDVYGAAATIYRAITGKTPPEAAIRAENDRIQPPSELGAMIPAEAETALMKALSLRPKERFQTVDAFQAALSENLSKTVVNNAGGPIIVDGLASGSNFPVTGHTAAKEEPVKSNKYRCLAFVPILIAFVLVIIRTSFGPSFRNAIRPEKTESAQSKGLGQNHFTTRAEFSEKAKSSIPPAVKARRIPMVDPKVSSGNNSPGNGGSLLERKVEADTPAAKADSGVLSKQAGKILPEVIGERNLGAFTIPSDAEGFQFTADATGIYWFTIAGGAYTNYKEDDPRQFWETLYVIYKNRPVFWSETLIPTRWDFFVGDGSNQKTPQAAEQIGKGMYDRSI